jgi:hypothetical protein
VRWGVLGLSASVGAGAIKAALRVGEGKVAARDKGRSPSCVLQSMLQKTAWVVILIDDEDTHRAVGQIGVFVFHGSVTLAHDGPILPPL